MANNNAEVTSIRAYVRRMNNLDIEAMTEIKRQLNRYRYDGNYRGRGGRVPWKQFAALCHVSRQTLYDIVRGDRKGIEPTTRDRLFTAIKLIEQGLRWRRHIDRAINPGEIVWQPVMPNGQPPPPIPQPHRSAKQIASYAASGQRISRLAIDRYKKKNDHPNL